MEKVVRAHLVDNLNQLPSSCNQQQKIKNKFTNKTNGPKTTATIYINISIKGEKRNTNFEPQPQLLWGGLMVPYINGAGSINYGAFTQPDRQWKKESINDCGRALKSFNLKPKTQLLQSQPSQRHISQMSKANRKQARIMLQ